MTLDDLIVKALTKGDEADVHVLARRLLTRVTPEMREEIVLYGLTERVALSVREMRARRTFVRTADVDVTPGPSKWDQCRREFAPFVNKFLDECNADDLRVIVARYDGQIAGMSRERDYYEGLLGQLEKKRAATVADLEGVVLGRAA